MALNPDKSEAILLNTRQRGHSYSSLATVNVAGSQIPLADHIKILGVTLDKNLNVIVNKHVMLSVSPFIITSVPYATSVPLYLKTWPKWLRVPSLAPASTTLTLFYLEPLRKTSPNSKKAQNLLARVVTCSPQSSVSSSSSTGFRVNTTSTSK